VMRNNRKRRLVAVLPILILSGDGNTESWIGALTEMRKLPVKILCPGHGEMSDITLTDRQRRYFVELRQFIGDAIARGTPLPDIEKTTDFPWHKECRSPGFERRPAASPQLR
ncbi:MAG: hypothetical protein ACM3U2_00210, partial [Deltaproteobacteria bacterium]